MAYHRLYQFAYTDAKGAVHKDQDTLFNIALKDKKRTDTGMGMCLAISCDWARTSLQYRSVTRRDQLNPGRWPIIQSAYQIGMFMGDKHQKGVRAIRNSGLTVTSNNGQGLVYNTGSVDVVAEYLKLVSGHCVFGIFGPASAHAMGYRFEGNSVEFVEPNTGHYKGDDRDELLRDHVKPLLEKYCSDLLETILICEVKLG